jgi:hypothetical protein
MPGFCIIILISQKVLYIYYININIRFDYYNIYLTILVIEYSLNYIKYILFVNLVSISPPKPTVHFLDFWPCPRLIRRLLGVSTGSP